MFTTLIFRLIRSRRVAFAVFGNGMFSLASFALSIAVARASTVGGFADFSLAMVAYLFVSGLTHAALTNTALSCPEDGGTLVRAARRASLLGLFVAVILIAGGMLSGNDYLLILGFSAHGILMMDFVRTFETAAGSSARAVVGTSSWALLSLVASIAGILVGLDPVVVFTAWAVSGAVCGYGLVLVTRMPLRPAWTRERQDTRAAAYFSADYLIGQGGVHLTTSLLGVVGDARVLGGVRGAGTLLGPMNLIATTAGSLMLPYLARDKDNPIQQRTSGLAAVAVQMTVLVPLLLVLQFIPDSLGNQLLGETWQYAALAILPLSIDSVFAMCAEVAIAGHRVASAGPRSLLIRLITGLPRPVLVLVGAYHWGISGAAWMMALSAFIRAVVWWGSYWDLSRRAAKEIAGNGEGKNFEQNVLNVTRI